MPASAAPSVVAFALVVVLRLRAGFFCGASVAVSVFATVAAAVSTNSIAGASALSAARLPRALLVLPPRERLRGDFSATASSAVAWPVVSTTSVFAAAASAFTAGVFTSGVFATGSVAAASALATGAAGATAGAVSATTTGAAATVSVATALIVASALAWLGASSR